MALPLVLTVLVVMFLLGGTVAGLCISQARMARLHWEQTQSRQQAMAGLVEAQTWLNPSIDWTTGQANYADHEFQADPDIAAFYTIHVESATRDSATIVSTGYFKNPDGSRRNAVSERSVFQRAAFGFRYPVQTLATIKLTTSHIVAPTNDIALRTNDNAIISDNSTVIEGDVILNGVAVPTSTSGTIHGNVSMTQLIAQLFPAVVPASMSAGGPSISMP